MGDGSEITLLTIFNEIGNLRHDVFQSIQHDQEQCRLRHDEINKEISASKKQNGAQDKHGDDLEKRFRTMQTTVIAASGAVAVIVFMLKYL